MINLVCTFEKKIFENIATGYCVAAFKTDDEVSVPQDARSKFVYKDKKIRFTAVGYGIPATDSIDLELEGKWQTTKYGVQLVIEHFAEIIPASIEGIIKGATVLGLVQPIYAPNARIAHKNMLLFITPFFVITSVEKLLTLLLAKVLSFNTGFIIIPP